MLLAILTLMLTFTLTAFADNTAIVLQGYTDFNIRSGNANLAASTAEAWNYRVVRAGGDSATPLSSKQDLETAITKAAQGLKPGDTFIFFFHDHGNPPDDLQHPASAKIVMNNFGSKIPIIGSVVAPANTVTYDELAKILKDKIPESVHLKVVSQACFSGGVHEISFGRPNTCSLSATDYKSVSQGDRQLSHVVDRFDYGLWQKNGENEHPTLAKGAEQIQKYDSRNRERSTLSSQSYVDKILKSGPYAAPSFTEQYLWHIDVMHLLGQSRLADAKIDTDCLPGQVAQVTKLANDTADVFEKLLIPELSELNLPAELKARFEEPIQTWKAHAGDYAKRIAEAKNQMAALMAEWKTVSAQDRRKKRAAYVKKFSDLRASTAESLGDIEALYGRILEARHTADFLKVAKKEQIQKFIELSLCEQEPLK